MSSPLPGLTEIRCVVCDCQYLTERVPQDETERICPSCYADRLGDDEDDRPGLSEA